MSILDVLFTFINFFLNAAKWLWEIATALPIVSVSIIIVVAVGIIYLIVGR